MAHAAESSTNGARDGQPSLGLAFRQRHCRDTERFWAPGRGSVESRTIGLAGIGIRAARLEHQANAPADRNERDLSAGVAGDAGIAYTVSTFCGYSFEELAAAYAVYIVQGPVFLDGNKRAAGAAMTTFFAANGGRLRLTVPGLVKLMFELQTRAEAGARTDELVAWVAGLLGKKSHRVRSGESSRNR